MDTADVSHAACTGAALGSLAWVCFQPRDELLQSFAGTLFLATINDEKLASNATGSKSFNMS